MKHVIAWLWAISSIAILGEGISPHLAALNLGLAVSLVMDEVGGVLPFVSLVLIFSIAGVSVAKATHGDGEQPHVHDKKVAWVAPCGASRKQQDQDRCIPSSN